MKLLGLILALITAPAVASLLLVSGSGVAAPEGGSETINLVQSSEDFAVSPWTNIAGGPTLGDGATEPGGGSPSDRMTRIDGPDDGRIQSITLATNTVYTVSCSMRNVDSAESDLFIFRTGGASLAELEIVWSGATPSEGGGNSANSENVQFTDLGDDWWRISYTFTSHASETAHLLTLKPEATAGAENNGNSVDYADPQLEIGSTLTAYVET